MLELHLIPCLLLKFGALALCCRGTKSAGGGGGPICAQWSFLTIKDGWDKHLFASCKIIFSEILLIARNDNFLWWWRNNYTRLT